MRQVLRYRRLVHEESVHAEDACDLAQGVAGAARAAAHVVARAEIDDEVERRGLERQIADVLVKDRCVDPSVRHSTSRQFNEHGIDVHADKHLGREALHQNGQRDTASAPHLEHSPTAREAQRADHRGNLEALLKAVASLHVLEGHVCATLLRSMDGVDVGARGLDRRLIGEERRHEVRVRERRNIVLDL